MANKYKGEFEIVLAGTVYTIRPTFEAMVDFEDKAGITAYDAIKKLAAQDFPLRAVAAALWSGIKHGWYVDGKRAPSYGEVGGMIHKDGLMNIVQHYAKFLNNGMSSEADREAAAKAEEEAAKKALADAEAARKEPTPI